MGEQDNKCNSWKILNILNEQKMIFLYCMQWKVITLNNNDNKYLIRWKMEEKSKGNNCPGIFG